MKRTFLIVSILVVGIAGGATLTYLLRASTSDAGPAVDPRSVSRAGIPPAMHGFAAVGEAGFRLAYAPSQDATHDQIRELFIADGVLDRVARALNQTLAMPGTVDIQMVDCGAPNAFYDPQGHRIIVCYELITYFIDTFRGDTSSEAELGNAAIGATFFAFFHELGHALIHELDLASTGREEDAADQVATLVLLEAGDQGVQMALSGARWFGMLAKQEHRTPFWDEHGLDGQRFFNVVCMVYGEAPGTRADLVSSGVLPEDRAKRCPSEYAKLDAAWDKLLAPHLRARGADEPVAQAPSRAPSADTGATCAAVGARAREIIRAEVQPKIDEELASRDPEERPLIDAQVEERLATLAADVERRCTTEGWPPDVRTCLASVASTAETRRCVGAE
jgi:hypothetical protein